MTDIAEVVAPLVADCASTHHCPEISWGVVVDGALVAHSGTPDRVFRIASMTKSFTCAAVLALRDEGALSLDAPIADHAPELAGVRGPAGSAAITLRHLLSMTSGLATDDPWADRHLDMTPDELDRVCAAGPRFAARPGDRFEYSNLGFGLVGRVVERATGRRVQDHVTERFLVPLGMTSTTWVRPDHDDWARPHHIRDGAAVPDPVAPLGDGEIAPMGGLWSTVADLAIWTMWFDDAIARPDASTWIGLSPASRREMQRQHTYMGRLPVAGRKFPSGYGFGLQVRDDADLGTLVAHSGGLPGYGSNMRWCAGRGVAAIALGNVMYAPMSDLTMSMLVELDSKELVPHLGRTPVHDVERLARHLVDVLDGWHPDDPGAAHHRLDDLFADNVDLDLDLGRRARAAHAIVTSHGHLSIDRITSKGAADAKVDLTAEDGTRAIVELSLAPIDRPLVQHYTMTVIPKIST